MSAIGLHSNTYKCLLLWWSGVFMFVFSAFGQIVNKEITIQPVGQCAGDSQTIQVQTSGVFLGWEVQGGGVNGIQAPLKPLTSVQMQAPTTYIATAQFNSVQLIVNGDFELGNKVGFSSDYKRSDTLNKNTGYSVLPRHPKSGSAYVKKRDKTSGNGNMLLVDCSKDSSKAFYRTNLYPTKGVTYTFSLWVCNIHKEFANPVPDTLESTTGWIQIDLGDSSILGEYKVPLDTQWHQVIIPWTAPSSDMVQLAIRSKNTSVEGNDIAVDDISMVSGGYTKQASITLSPCQSGTVISPDGDGWYDTYYVSEPGHAKVYDLNGSLVKELHTPAHWDGTHKNGSYVEAGYYAIVVNGDNIHRISVMR